MTILLAALMVGVLPMIWPARATPGLSPVPPLAPPKTGTSSAAEDVLSVACALDLMALALGSGVPLVTAVEVVAERSGPVVAAHLRQVVAALRWGVAEARAWDGLPSIWRPAGQAVALAGMAGVPPAGLLKSAAADMRRAEQRRIEEATGRLSVLVVIPLGLCFLPAFALLTVVPVIAALAGDLLTGMR